uniref:Enoyl reductase (ER) domain-containing protein n=1 Tax=Globisporangium ultimum (strain ATCC 200006 / CBS 805.95 / DAOM BR144) TaxID=431595 RepID=K3WJC2_GLOUD
MAAAPFPTTFRAFRYVQHGKPDKVLQLRPRVAQAPLGSAQVRVKVHSAAINPIDIALVPNYTPDHLHSHPTEDKPFGIGFDGAGTIVEVGASVDPARLRVGDNVYFMMPFTEFGTFAEYLTVDADFVALKPKNMSFDQAACVPLVALTSYQALVEYCQLKKGERVLILGGSSATGFVAIQLAKAIGAHVITTTSDKNFDFVKSFGADQLIDYTNEKWVDVLPPHSIDVLYDCGMEPMSWNSDAQTVLTKNSGRYVTLWPLPNPIEPRFGAKLVGSILVYPSASQLDELTKLIEAGKIVIPIDSVFALEQVLDAIARIKTRRATGKIVIQIANAERQTSAL